MEELLRWAYEATATTTALSQTHNGVAKTWIEDINSKSGAIECLVAGYRKCLFNCGIHDG
jgi:hypothetical protein